mmetsp:Transcript_18024/g.68008  ORF Transcript_18024/g.68008 Transcript_18024/m.68008 type:complete len:434 (+) Transcript_18024:762-2063(+)
MRHPPVALPAVQLVSLVESPHRSAIALETSHQGVRAVASRVACAAHPECLTLPGHWGGAVAPLGEMNYHSQLAQRCLELEGVHVLQRRVGVRERQGRRRPRSLPELHQRGLLPQGSKRHVGHRRAVRNGKVRAVLAARQQHGVGNLVHGLAARARVRQPLVEGVAATDHRPLHLVNVETPGARSDGVLPATPRAGRADAVVLREHGVAHEPRGLAHVQLRRPVAVLRPLVLAQAILCQRFSHGRRDAAVGIGHVKECEALHVEPVRGRNGIALGVGAVCVAPREPRSIDPHWRVAAAGVELVAWRVRPVRQVPPGRVRLPAGRRRVPPRQLEALRGVAWRRLNGHPVVSPLGEAEPERVRHHVVVRLAHHLARVWPVLDPVQQRAVGPQSADASGERVCAGGGDAAQALVVARGRLPAPRVPGAREAHHVALV